MGQKFNALSNDAAHSLNLLKEGNNRFVNGMRSIEIFASKEKLKNLATIGQSPFCIVLTCSDSRVPVETVFDRGVGDLFVIRVAGNVVSSDLIGSIEYAAFHFSTPLCLVMGHTNCGAVAAAVEYSNTTEKPPTCSISGLLEKISPSVREAKAELKQCTAKRLIQASTVNNVKNSIQTITKGSTLIHGLIASGSFSVVGGLYDIKTGAVNFNLDTEVHDQVHSDSEQGPVDYDQPLS